jgi:hypothetical protein
MQSETESFPNAVGHLWPCDSKRGARGFALCSGRGRTHPESTGSGGRALDLKESRARAVDAPRAEREVTR